MCCGTGTLLWSPEDIKVTRWLLVAQGALGIWALHTDGFLQGLLLAQNRSKHGLEENCWPNRWYFNVFQIHVWHCRSIVRKEAFAELKKHKISNQQLSAMWSWAVFYPLLAEVFSWALSVPAVCRCATVWARVYFCLPPTVPKSKPRSIAEINRYFWHVIPLVFSRHW